MVIASAGKKDLLIILKPLNRNQDQHLTFVLKQNGYAEFHLTKEKPKQFHFTLLNGQLNLNKLKFEAEKLYKRSIKPIRKDDKRYKDFLVFIPKDLNHLTDFYTQFIKKNKFVYTLKDNEEFIEAELSNYFTQSSFGELNNVEFDFAFAFSSRGNLYYLFVDQGNRYLFPISQALKILPNAIEWKGIVCLNCYCTVKIDNLECPTCRKKIEKESLIELVNLFKPFSIRL